MKVQTYDYNSVYLLAAPFVQVGVSGDSIDAEPILVNVQIDTGADASMMPVAVLESTGALFESTRYARDFSGKTHLVDLYSVTVSLAGQTFYLQVIAQENTDEGIIGRDILNNLVVTLNGPANTTEIALDNSS